MAFIRVCVLFFDTNIFKKKFYLCAKRFKSELAQIIHTQNNIQRKLPSLCCVNLFLTFSCITNLNSKKGFKYYNLYKCQNKVPNVKNFPVTKTF